MSYADPAAEVVVDAERCTVFAPSVPGGWSGVPARFAVLSDGAVVGRVTSVAGNVVRLAAPPALERATAQDGQVTVPPPPAGVKVDAVSRAVFVPSELEGQMAWLPDDICRVESGLSFVLAKGVEVREDGSWSVPSGLCEPKAAAGALAATGRHGEVTRRSEYLGLVERTHADGWTCLELPADAEPTRDGRLLLASSARRAPGSVPPLLRVEAQADGRLALQLPAGTEQRTDGVWFSSPLEPADDELVLADHDGAVQDEQSYMGIRDALLEGDWIRLDLPAGSRVDDGALVLPPEFSALGDPRLRGAFDRLADGSLVFKLPDGAEVLGSRVLIPPAGAVSVAATPAATASAPPKAPTPPKAPSKSKGKKLSGLDRFRGSKATNDEVSFDGVLKSDDTAPEDESPAEDKSEDETPADEAPADEAPADETPADETPADEAPADETPADEAPADETPEDETPADETPADEKPEGETPDGESSDGETPEAASADATGTRKKTKRKRRKRKKK